MAAATVSDEPSVRELIEGLSRPAAYPYPCDRVDVVQTHVSVVFLAGHEVYKVKKAVDLGFLDASSLQRRLELCRAEVELNRRLAPDVYLGVVPITRGALGLQVGGDGEVVEHAVRMRRLPDDRSLAALVGREEVTDEQVAALARVVARFHARARRGPDVDRHGRAFDDSCRENFAPLGRGVGQVVSAAVLRRLEQATEAELGSRRADLEARCDAGTTCEGHGDLRLEHVYFLDGEVVIIDCVEFSERLRCADPFSDLAFLVMELALASRRDLARLLVERYVEESGDEGGLPLLPLFTAYRATVRAKVAALAQEEAEIPAERRAELVAAGRGCALLALGELVPPSQRPCLLLVIGLPGTGKSVLARGLAQRAGFTWVCSDEVRKQLAGVTATTSCRASFGQGIYTPEWSERTYAACLQRAEDLLFAGRRVLVDANFREEDRRHQFLDLARRMGTPARVILCEADEDVVRDRLARRAESPSDADWGVYEAARARWQGLGPRTRRFTRPVAASGTAEATLGATLQDLREADLL